MRKLPSLNAVRMFEAAARHVGFTKAAQELHVTHGAVSRQVALLEDWLGVKLFRRTASQLSLTEAGLDYYREVTAILDRLALASMDMKQRASPTALRVNAPPTFALRWLIGRIASFQRHRADIELQLTSSYQPIHANEAGFDVAIRREQGGIPGWQSHHFMTELIVPVCRASVASRHRLEKPEDLHRQTLLTYLTEPYGWHPWFANVGGEMSNEQDILRFEQMYFALQAMLEGMGVGLFPIFLLLDELIDGRLCLPFGMLGLRRQSYAALYRADMAQWSAVTDFHQWLATAGRATELATEDWIKRQGWKL